MHETNEHKKGFFVLKDDALWEQDLYFNQSTSQILIQVLISPFG